MPASCSTTSSLRSPERARRPPMICGWWIPHRSSAAGAARRRNARIWPGSPNTATALRIHGSSGDCALHLVTTTSGLPLAFALTGAKADERDTCLDMIAFAGLDTQGTTLIADKGYRRASFEAELNDVGITLIRPSLKSEKPRGGRRFLKAFRQIIESVNQTFKAQLDLERHGARTRSGVAARVLQRVLASTAAIWHNETSGATGPPRSLLAYDH